MPIYEYTCNACGHEFELLQHIGDLPPEICPECGEQQVRKLISMTSFVLKGSGWYRDHYGLKRSASSSTSSSTGSTSKSSSTAAAAAAK